MINKEDFIKLIEHLKLADERGGELYKLGVDTMELNDSLYRAVDILFSAVFNEEQRGWVEWFTFDCDFGRKELKARDKEGNPIVRNVEELWDEINTLKDDY